MSQYYRIPLILLVVFAAVLALGFYALGASGALAAVIPWLGSSVAGLMKDALFVPLRPVMYALIILSIGASVATSTGGLGAKFARVLGFFVLFSLIGVVVAVGAYSLFPDIGVFESPQGLGLGGGGVMEPIPFPAKIYGVLTSPLMISIYGGLLLGRALQRLEATRPGIGREADAVSDLFIAGFIKFLWITIPLAVFGSLTLAFANESGMAQLGRLLKLLPVYLGAMAVVWAAMILIASRVLGHGLGHMFRALLPQATVALATSSSMATLPATRIACDQLGADADEATPFYTIGATVNMVGTLMGLTLISLYGMNSFGVEAGIADRFVVAFQSMVYATSAAGVPSSSVVLLQEILTSQGVTLDYGEYIVGLIITLDTLVLDRMRTILNTQSDSMSTASGLKTYYRKPEVLRTEAAE